MIITLKNLQQQTFQLDMDDTSTVKQLKEKIYQEKGNDYPSDNQRLIYAGKILADEHTLQHYNIDPKKFIVVMVTKSKIPEIPASAPPPTVTTPAVAATATATTPAPAAAATPVAPPTPVTPAPITAPAPAPAVQLPLQGLLPAELDPEETAAHESRVRALLDMGYPRPQVEQALRASFDNQERAVEYLINGIPDELLQEQVDQLEAEGEVDENAEDPLAFLRDQPQFQQMRAVIQQDPTLLHTILQQIGQTNPALLQAISQHQQAFVRMLNEPTAPGSGSTPVAPASSARPAAAAATPGRQTLQISMQDKEAIERLKALGFPEHMVIQAYFACEKNENLAANFLLSMNTDD